MNSAPGAVLTAQTISHRGTLRLAVPVMLANLSTPLIGVVDTAVVGQLADPALIGAVAVGALIFTTLFWAFAFLRMGTAGLSAQAVGAGLHDELVAIDHCGVEVNRAREITTGCITDFCACGRTDKPRDCAVSIDSQNGDGVCCIGSRQGS